VFRARAARLQDHLAERLAAGLAPLPCSLGYPPGGLAAEQLWVAAGFTAQLPHGVSGGGARDETGTLVVRISVTRTTDSFAAVRDRALEIVGAVEDLIAEDPTLGGLATLARVAQVQVEEARPEDRAVQAGATVTVEDLATVTA
jgi:hypothetical protein